MTAIAQELDGDIVVHIPESIAQTVDLHAGDTVFVALSGGKIIVSKTADKCTLDDLLAGITDDNRHDEIEL